MKKLTLLATCAVLLTGCQQTSSGYLTASPFQGFDWGGSGTYGQAVGEGASLNFDLAKHVPEEKVNTKTRALIAEGAKALDEERLDDASELFNTALKLDLANSHLHFMNALTYHLMAKGGNTKNFEFAEQGYKLAHKFDNTNVLAKYYLGLAYLDQRKFKPAQAALAEAAVMDEEDAEILYDLARASYYAGDPRISKAALDKISEIEFGPMEEEKFVRASLLTNAALDRPAEAERLLERFKEDPKTHKYLSKRMAAWKRFHEQDKDKLMENASFQLAQLLPAGAPAADAIPGANLNYAIDDEDFGEASDFINSEMAVVDVVIIRTQEDVSTNRGLNLLSGLQLQFGDSLTNADGFSFSTNRVDDNTALNNDINTQTVSSLISIPSVNYSLNIFNTLDSRNEILASPSLVALANEKSEFFSGTDVIAAAVSGGDGSSISVNKQIGVKLSVVPEFLSDDQIKLQVQAERTFLTSPSSSVQFEFRLDTSNTNVNANVVMKFGETLILSGLSEKEIENGRDAVPLLGDIPVIQYLFANQSKRDFRKSVLIMLTPRRAHYVNRDPKDRAKMEAKLTDFERSLSTFEERNKNWFTPPSTTTEIMKITQMNSLFNEFKTGDFELENWNSRDTHEKRLTKAVDFLFY